MNDGGAAAIGLIGLGTMGSALALNIAEKGFPIAVFNRTPERTREFVAAAGNLGEKLLPATELRAFVASLSRPRKVIVMVPAGTAVDAQTSALQPLLEPGDIVIDAGNSEFRDTVRRQSELAPAGLRYLGVGVSGGEDGARHGPAIMAGGPRDAWDEVSEILLAIAARYRNEPCAAWVGPGGAGHFVKTVHNGIEYADMQMIAEAYGILRDGMAMAAPDIADVFARWNEGALQSYLIEIAAKVARAGDPQTGKPVLDVILDRAGQKGTGRWTAIEAQHLGAPAGTIEAAFGARNLSSRLDERRRGEELFGPAPHPIAPGAVDIATIEQALIAGKIVCYAQGFGLLAAASAEHGWSLDLSGIARIWRAGCIIRSAMLDDMASALAKSGGGGLLFAPFFADLLKRNSGGLRQTVSACAAAGLAAPALSAALSHFDMMRTARSTANMIQAQRDFFGAHSFERVDRSGSFHGPWAR